MKKIQLATAQISKLSHDGRGIAIIDGKMTFVRGALKDETIQFQYKKRHARFDEGIATDIINPAKERVAPQCPHFMTCGGCSLQHLEHSQQIKLKQETLQEHFEHFGQIQPIKWLPALTGPIWHYRHKARLSVKFVTKKNKVLVGFREIDGRFVADLKECPILHTHLAHMIPDLSQLIGTLNCYQHIPQIEVAVSDQETALVMRHLKPLSDSDQTKIIGFAKQYRLLFYSQAKGLDGIVKLWPDDEKMLMQYSLAEHQINLQFHPCDFTQVNFKMNHHMIKQALHLLQLQAQDRVLDLFCGLGNFSLPIARYSAKVVGVEGEKNMVERAKQNAVLNQLNHVEFFAANLTQDISDYSWAKQTYDKILLDPPRTGAAALIPQIARFKAPLIVYISCNPATLARDAGLLKDVGYQLQYAGIMDMFPHTSHVESIAVFSRY